MRRRRFVRHFVAAFAVATTSVPAAIAIAAPLPSGAAGTVDDSAVSTRRERDLAQRLRCPVCQNQTIADSGADLAKDLRRQVRAQIAAGRSDEQIVQFMVQRYGDFVLYDPPVKPATLLLWLGPALLMACGTGLAVREVRRRRRAGTALPLAEAEIARAQALLRGAADAAMHS